MPTAVTFYAYAFEGAPLHGTLRGWLAAPYLSHLVAPRARTALGRAIGSHVAIYRCRGVIQDQTVRCDDAALLLHRDATVDLRWFALFCARSVLNKWQAPAPVVEYLKTGHQDLRAEAHRHAWLASATLAGNARLAARVAMYAAHDEQWVASAREAARLSAQLAGDDLRAAAANQERALSSTLLAVVEKTIVELDRRFSGMQPVVAAPAAVSAA